MRQLVNANFRTPERIKQFRKIGSLVLVAVVSVLLGLSTYQLTAAPQSAALSARPSKINFGDVLDGALVNLTFHIANASDFPVHIENVVTSCGCTTASSPAYVAPRGSTDLHVVFDSTEHLGEATKNIVLTYSSGAQKHVALPLSFHGHVRQNIIADPEDAINFGTVQPGVYAVRLLKFRSADNKPLKIREVKVIGPENAQMSAHLSDVHGASGAIVATMKAPHVAGAYDAVCKVNFADQRPPKRFAMDVLVRSVYKLSSPSLNYGVVRPGSNTTRTITISGSNFSWLKLTHVPDNIVASLSRKGGQTILTAVWYAGTPANKALDDSIEISTKNMNEPTLALPVYGLSSN